MLLFELCSEDKDILKSFSEQFPDCILDVQKSSFEGGDCFQQIVELTSVTIPILAGIICTYIKYIKSKRIKIKYKGMEFCANLKDNVTAQEVINILESVKSENND